MNNERNYPVSFFPALSSSQPSVINFSTFIDAVRTGRWREHTERYRRLLADGNAGGAAAVKRQSPGITPSGVFTGGHGAEHFTAPSELLCLDYDKCGSQLAHIREVCMRMSETVGILTSLSGIGLKVVVRIPVVDKERYKAMYRMVMNRYDRATGVAADRSCKDICRLCFVSYDPEAWYNPTATPFQPACTSLDLHLCLDEAEDKYPITEGVRNSNLLKLLSSALRRGFSFEELLQVSLERYAQPGFEEGEITKILEQACGYAEQGNKPENAWLGSTWGQGFNIAPPKQTAPDPDDLERDEKLRSEAPRFPDHMFDNLPVMLNSGLKAASNHNQRDMLLMGMIAVLSGCIPKTEILHSDKKYSPHIYFFGVANAGTGKGIVENARLLAEPLHQWYMKQGEESVKKYEFDKLEWDQEIALAFKEKRKADITKKPEEPRRIYLLIPGNASRARHLIHMRDNGSLGGIIHCTEADDLTTAISQECGQQHSLFRNAFHHEHLSASHKANGEPIYIDNPALCLCLTGTPAQLVRFTPQAEDGLYSRFALLTQGTEYKWISPAPRKGRENKETLFKRLGEEVLEMHKALLISPTEVVFSDEQWDRYNLFFEGKTNEIAAENRPYASGIVFRHGVIALRIAAILTVLRKWEKKNLSPGQTECLDSDFDTMLAIIRVILEHSLLLSTSLASEVTKVNPLQPFYKLRCFLDKMPEKFTYTEMKNICEDEKIPLTTAKRNLKKAISLNLLIHKEKYYYKVNSTYGVGL